MANLIIISALFPPEPVVSANLSHDISLAISTRVSLIVVTPFPTRPLGFEFNSKTSINNLSYKHIQLNSYTCPQSKIFGRLKESYSFGKHCSTFIKQNAHCIDVIYANTWPLLAQFLVVRASKQNKIPIIIHVQDVYPESLTNKLSVSRMFVFWLLLSIDKYTLRNASRVIAISDKMKDYLVKNRKLDSPKVHVIPNWQDEEEFIEFRQSKNGNECFNDFVFMYLGNIGPVAGIELLINGFTKAGLPNSKLIIAGSGTQKKALQKKCIDQHLLNIEFLSVPDGKVPEVQDKASILLLPIKKGAALSSIPSKLPAYMFSAKPIIACVDANSDTANAIVEAGCGWVLEPENDEKLAKYMKEAYFCQQKILDKKGQNGFDYAIKHFSKSKNLPIMINTILSVI